MDTPNQYDAYVHYEFVYVLCNECGEKSNDFVFKDHLNADETIEYIKEITGFIENRTEGERTQNFIRGMKNYDKGGLICPTCIENKQYVKEVV